MQAGWFELQNTRDWYRQACGPAGMKRSHMLRFIEVRPPTQNPEHFSDANAADDNANAAVASTRADSPP